MSEPQLRRAGPSDDAGIRALLARTFPENVKAEAAFTRWQYWDNPFGAARSWVFEDAGRIVAHWAAVPVPMVLAGLPARGAKGVDGATDRDYRGRGLFRSLGQAMAADCREQGFTVILTHPNVQSARGVEQAGAHLIARVPVYVRPLDDGWLAGRLHLPRPAAAGLRRSVFAAPAGAPGRQVGGPPDGLDALWAETGGAVANGIARDEGWWRWRYGARPGDAYRYAEVRTGGRLRAAAVGTVRDTFGAPLLLVLDLLATDAAAARGALAALAHDRGEVAGAAIAALPRTPLARWALRAGFRRLPRRLEPHPFRFMVFDCGAGPDLGSRSWTMAWGDLDHL